MVNYKSIVIFASGVSVGVLASWQYFKQKYEQIANEEIESVKKTFGVTKPPVVKDEPEETVEDKHRDILPETLYEKVNTHVFGYDTVSTVPSPSEVKMAEKQAPNELTEPYIITMEQFADAEPYFDKVTLRYQTDDGELMDEMSSLFVNVDDTIGQDNLSLFLESDEDVMYVRDERTSIDYEVIKT